MFRFRNLAAAAALVVLAVTGAHAQGRVEIGVLTCRGGEARGVLVWSEQTLQCWFRGRFGARHSYAGVVRRLGVDVGIVRRSALVWSVLAPTRLAGPGEIAGSYVGASAGAAVGVGGAANLLVGGSNRSIALQPLSVEAQTGLNVALGFAELVLWQQ